MWRFVRLLAGAGRSRRSPSIPAHARALERAVLEQFTASKRCPRKPNRPPGEQARAQMGSERRAEALRQAAQAKHQAATKRATEGAFEVLLCHSADRLARR